MSITWFKTTKMVLDKMSKQQFINQQVASVVESVFDVTVG